MKLASVGAMLLLISFLPCQAQAQCNSSSLDGTYFYLLAGTVKSPTSSTATLSYEELAELIFNGNGLITGSTTTSTAGVIATLSVTGTYSIQANCSGTVALTTSAQTEQLSVQLINGGGIALASVTASPLGEIGNGRIYRAANATGSQCGNGSAQGAYGLLLAGGTYVGTARTDYENVAQVAFDGNGNVTVAGEVTTPSAVGTPWTGTGTYSIAANCTGTVQVTTGAGVQNFLLAKINGGTLLLEENDANTAVSGSAEPQALQDILPQLAFGDGWYTALYFTNANSSTVSFLVTFTSDAGAPLSIPGVGTSQVVTLGPLQTTVIEALNTGTTLSEGYASVSLPVGVSAYGVFRQSVTGRPDQEAVVGFKSATSTAESLIFDNTTLTTSVAIVNPSTVTATISVTAWGANGNVLGTTSTVLAPGTKTEGVLSGFLGLSGITGHRGSALFSVTTGNVSVLGLRFGAIAFTSIPTTQQQ
jgi:hypothetical protein